MKTFSLAKGVPLPLEIITNTIAILAKRRAGKSYTMRKLVEQLLTAGQQVCLVDPKGDQWGIRSSADGKSAGFPIVILGGEHGDTTLEPSAGEVVAKLVVHERVSVLLDLSFFRKHEVATFMAAFLENLYRLKAQEAYRTPMMLVIDEADAIAPQKPQKGEERMLGAAEDIVRRGGQRGIGCALITQRSAVLNKNVLTQAQMLIVLRTIAPQDLAAMKAWIDVHGTLEQGKELMDSLPALPTGDAWFWSPGWPTAEGIFKRAHVLPIETFDSGATPKPGQKPIVPKNLADVDLEALKKQMAATIEKAKNDDPKLLRKRIAELEQEKARSKPDEKFVEHLDTKVNEREIQKRINDAVREAVATKDEELFRWQGEWMKQIENWFATLKMLGETMQEWKKTHRLKPKKYMPAVSPAPVRGIEEIKKLPSKPIGEFAGIPVSVTADVSSREQRILDAIAWLDSIGAPATTTAVAFIAHYTESGNYNNLKGGLRTKGFIEYPTPGMIALTAIGRTIANAPDETPTQDELRRRVRDVIKERMWKILEPAIASYPEEISVPDLAQQAGYEMSGNFNNLKGRLRSLGLLDYPRPGYVKASDILFL